MRRPGWEENELMMGCLTIPTWLDNNEWNRWKQTLQSKQTRNTKLKLDSHSNGTNRVNKMYVTIYTNLRTLGASNPIDIHADLLCQQQFTNNRHSYRTNLMEREFSFMACVWVCEWKKSKIYESRLILLGGIDSVWCFANEQRTWRVLFAQWNSTYFTYYIQFELSDENVMGPLRAQRKGGKKLIIIFYYFIYFFFALLFVASCYHIRIRLLLVFLPRIWLYLFAVHDYWQFCFLLSHSLKFS